MCFQTSRLSTISNGQGIDVVEENMALVIDHFKTDPSVGFAHTISSDLDHERNMTAGVAVVFRKKFGRPQPSDYTAEKLTCQKVTGGACVYSLVTKPAFYGKPKVEDYNAAFAQLTQDFKAKELKKLICSPMGCVRDLIKPEQLAKNLVAFHQETGASVCIVSYDQKSHRELRCGLSHPEFLLWLKESILDCSRVNPVTEQESMPEKTLPHHTSAYTFKSHFSKPM